MAQESAFGGPAPSPDVLMAMRRPMLETLRERGAMSLSELVDAPVELLEAPLNRQQLEFLLDSARRNELVRPIDQRRPDGTTACEPEWVLTERGRHAVTRVGSWLVGLANRTTAIVKGAIPLLTGLVTLGLLKGFDVQIPGEILLLIALGAAFAAFLVLMLVWEKSRGANPGKVAQHWPLLQQDHPAAYEFQKAGEFEIRLQGYVGQLLGLVAIQGWLAGHIGWPIAAAGVGIGFAVGWITGRPKWRLLQEKQHALNEAKQAAAKRREAAAPVASAEEESG